MVLVSALVRMRDECIDTHEIRRKTICDLVDAILGLSVRDVVAQPAGRIRARGLECHIKLMLPGGGVGLPRREAQPAKLDHIFRCPVRDVYHRQIQKSRQCPARTDDLIVGMRNDNGDWNHDRTAGSQLAEQIARDAINGRAG